MWYDPAEYDVGSPRAGEIWRGTTAFLPRERSKEAQDRCPDDLQTLEVLEEVYCFNTTKASSAPPEELHGHGRARSAIAWLAGSTARMSVITCLTRSWSEETAGFCRMMPCAGAGRRRRASTAMRS